MVETVRIEETAISEQPRQSQPQPSEQLQQHIEQLVQQQQQSKTQPMEKESEVVDEPDQEATVGIVANESAEPLPSVELDQPKDQ